MGTHTVRYVRQRGGVYYFEATPRMRAAGLVSEPLGPDLATAVARAQALLATWDAIRRGSAGGPERGTLKWLVIEYERSDWYRVLAPRTKENADLHLARIAEALGKYGAAAIRRQHARAFHNRLIELRGRNAANEGIKWLRRLLNYAIELGLIEHNPAAAMGLHQPRPRTTRWREAEIATFKAKAIAMDRPAWALAVQLGYDTSQRLSDILALTWHDFDGEGLTVRQAKTGVEVWVPLSSESQRLLAEIERSAIGIIVGARGWLIGRTSFGRVFRQIRAAAGLSDDLQFRDLRRTAASEIYAGGGNIEPITGHRPGSPVTKHYIVPNKRAAREAQRARRRDDP